MSVDLSVRNYSPVARRAADALLRGLGGSTVALRIPLASNGSDAAQLGIAAQSYQQLPLSPALFRRVRTVLREGEPNRFELMVSASAVAVQVGALQLASADALFKLAAGLSVDGKLFLIEAAATAEAFGQAYVYHLQLREALPQGV